MGAVTFMVLCALRNESNVFRGPSADVAVPEFLLVVLLRDRCDGGFEFLHFQLPLLP